MEEIKTIKEKTIELIDALKATCQTYGMGNDGNEYKIITQVFLYKFLNDKFGYEVKKVSPVLKNAEKWELAYAEMSEDDRLDIFDSLPSDIPLLNPEHLIANLWNQQAKGDFDLIFDSTMTDIADKNIDIFSTQTAQNTKIPLFEKLTQYVTDDTARAPFARALVDKLVNFSFEEAFEKHYDFFADIFEYLINNLHSLVIIIHFPIVVVKEIILRYRINRSIFSPFTCNHNILHIVIFSQYHLFHLCIKCFRCQKYIYPDCNESYT